MGKKSYCTAFSLLAAISQLAAPAHAGWRQTNGPAQDEYVSDVGAGGISSPKVKAFASPLVPHHDMSGVFYGYQLYVHNYLDGWWEEDGAGYALDIMPGGRTVGIGWEGFMYASNTSGWDLWSLPLGESSFSDVGAGGSTSAEVVWALGSVPHYNAASKKIYRTTNGGSSWTQIAGAAKKIDVDSAGNAWAVGSDNAIYKYESNGTWTNKGGYAHDIGVGNNGSVFILNPSNSLVYKYSGSGTTWNAVAGSPTGHHISVTPNGKPWVAAYDGTIWTQD
jgi:hypothetical protein